MEKIKGSLRSKTMWFGLLVMITTWLANNTDLIQSFIPTDYRELSGYLIGALIWILRWITTKPVEQKVPEPKINLDDAYIKDF